MCKENQLTSMDFARGLNNGNNIENLTFRPYSRLALGSFPGVYSRIRIGYSANWFNLFFMCAAFNFVSSANY
ncbi:MAG: hypothetical protein BWY38_03263 [Ignavibacteria bacterium ADurb.Bin266]|nr:MAG: hypothetical protein BWY38_03263 [Ignavibacteria bacterium ADurb.Bin266]